MQFESSHPWHMDVGDQAAGTSHIVTCEKFRRRWEGLGCEPESLHQTRDGHTGVIIIVNDGNENIGTQNQASAGLRDQCDGTDSFVRATIPHALQRIKTQVGPLAVRLAPLDLSLGELSPVVDEAGFKSARSAILTRAATDRTPSFSPTRPRWSFTVASVTPS